MYPSFVNREELTMTNFIKSQRNFLRLCIAGTVVVIVALAVALLSGSGLVRAAGGGSPASNWHIGYYTPSSQTLSFAAAPADASGNPNLNFTNQSNTALLVTNNKAKFPSLLGDLTGKSVSATFTVSSLNTSTIFTYGGEPSCGGTTAYVRYYFETSNAGGFDETHYWWSNPVHIDFSVNGGPVSLGIVPLTGGNWSDYFGHFGNDMSNPAYSAGFNAAVSNVTEIGLSFGGGCFFENGVGTNDGSGTFTLNSYTAS
jgi:hypothetical protein